MKVANLQFLCFNRKKNDCKNLKNKETRKTVEKMSNLSINKYYEIFAHYACKVCSCAKHTHTHFVGV